jgi:hypothetical protein
MSWIVSGKQDVVGLLDAYPGAAAAYSLRALTYTQNVVRVRRSSDNAESDFTAAQVSDGSLAAWVGSGNTGTIITWYDQSGNGRHASTTVGNSPILVSNGSVALANSKPTCLWASDGNTNLSFGEITNARSVFTVRTASVTNRNDGLFFFGHPTVLDYHGGSGSEPTKWLAPGFAASTVVNGSNYINGVLTNLSTTDRNTNQNLFSMIHVSSSGRMSRISYDRTNAGRSWAGSIQEIVVYSTDVSANRANIESNINTHYAIY